MRFCDNLPAEIDRPGAPARRRRPRRAGLPAHHLRVGAAPTSCSAVARRRPCATATAVDGLVAADEAGRRPAVTGGGHDATATDDSTPTWWWPRRAPLGRAPLARPTRRRARRWTRRTPASSTSRASTGCTPAPSLPETSGPIGGDLGYLKYAVFLGDNRTFSVTFAVRTDDDELRGGCSTRPRSTGPPAPCPPPRPWAEPARAEPITRARHGRAAQPAHPASPTTTATRSCSGLHAVGDAHTCTNPLYGRGCSLAMVQADAARPTRVAAHPDDPLGAPGPTRRPATREIEPWYRASVQQDRMNREQAGARRRRSPRARSTRRRRRPIPPSSCRTCCATACCRRCAPTPRCSAPSSARSTCCDPRGDAHRRRGVRPGARGLPGPREPPARARPRPASPARCSPRLASLQPNSVQIPCSSTGSTVRPGKEAEPAALAAGRIAPLGYRRSRSAPMIDDGRGAQCRK